jgi:hypothetical protein
MVKRLKNSKLFLENFEIGSLEIEFIFELYFKIIL